VTTGGYQYIDANGLVQTVQYIADGLGFRVQGTNLPVAPVAIAATPLVTVGETEEVMAARAVFEAAYAAAAARTQEVIAVEEVAEEVIAEEVVAAVEEPVAEVVAERKKRDAEEEKAVLPAVLPYPYAAFGGAGLFAGLPADIVANIDTAVPTVAGLPTVAPYAGLAGFAGVAPYHGLAGVAPYAGLHAGFAGVAPYAGLHAGFAGVAPYAGLHAAAPLGAAAPLAATIPSREAVKTTIKLNPGHALFYRVD